MKRRCINPQQIFMQTRAQWTQQLRKLSLSCMRACMSKKCPGRSGNHPSPRLRSKWSASETRLRTARRPIEQKSWSATSSTWPMSESTPSHWKTPFSRHCKSLIKWSRVKRKWNKISSCWAQRADCFSLKKSLRISQDWVSFQSSKKPCHRRLIIQALPLQVLHSSSQTNRKLEHTVFKVKWSFKHRPICPWN